MVYGPGNKGNIHRMIDWVARGHFPPLPEVGNRRSIVHVANAVEAACLAAVCPAASGQTYIVTDGRPYFSNAKTSCIGLGAKRSCSISVVAVVAVGACVESRSDFRNVHS